MRTLLLLCLLLPLTVAACQEARTPGTGPGRPPIAKREPVYPYPECKACMAWLRKNVGEPDSLEALAWKRTPSEWGKHVVLSLKYRGKNDRGGWSVKILDLTVRNGKVIASQRWPDEWEWID